MPTESALDATITHGTLVNRAPRTSRRTTGTASTTTRWISLAFASASSSPASLRFASAADVTRSPERSVRSTAPSTSVPTAATSSEPTLTAPVPAVFPAIEAPRPIERGEMVGRFIAGW